MDSLLMDLRFAVRRLTRHSMFTMTAVLTLALGIGGNIGVFTIINAVLFRPIPQVYKSEELVRVYQTSAERPGALSSLSYPDFVDLQKGGAEKLTAAAMGSASLVLVGNADEGELVQAEIVSHNYFNVLGSTPALGRSFSSEDAESGAAPVAVFSHGLWKSRFGSDPGLIGKTIRINGFPATVIGIARPGFTGPRLERQPVLWVPIGAAAALERRSAARYTDRDTRWLQVIGRLTPGTSRDQARQQLSALALRLSETFPGSNRGRGFAVLHANELRLHPDARTEVVGLFSLLMAVVGMVLLITCANITSLLLARALTRQKEVDIELALGASRGRIIRRLLVETGMLAAAGGGAGLLVAGWTVRLLVGLKLPLVDPSALELSIDLRVLGFAVLVSVTTAVAVGLVPALRLARSEIAQSLRAAGAGAGGGAGVPGLRAALVISQVAISVVLLIGAGLFIRTIVRAHNLDPGFEGSKLLTFTVDLSRQGYSESQGRMFQRDVLERIGSVPGVESVTLTSAVPLGFDTAETTAFLQGNNSGKASAAFQVQYCVTAGNYFTMLKVPVIQGRGFDPNDGRNAPAVVLVNQTAARRFWPGENPLGKMLRVGAAGRSFREVVGVVRDFKTVTPWEAPQPQAYVPALERYEPQMSALVRCENPRTVVPAIRSRIREIDPSLPLLEVQTMSQRIDALLSQQQAVASVMSLFGALALLLAALGLSGLISFNVSRRTREIGIRVALGARPQDALTMMFRQGAILAGLGALIGCGIALVLGHLAGGFLGDLKAADPVAFAGASLLMFAVACAATYVPARRAARLDPASVLRCE